MSILLILAAFGGVGVGLTAAYTVTNQDRRIHFVEQNDLNDELDDLEINVDSGEHCVVCGDEVEPSNVGAVVRYDDDYRVVCDKFSCLDTYDMK